MFCIFLIKMGQWWLAAPCPWVLQFAQLNCPVLSMVQLEVQCELPHCAHTLCSALQSFVMWFAPTAWHFIRHFSSHSSFHADMCLPSMKKPCLMVWFTASQLLNPKMMWAVFWPAIHRCVSLMNLALIRVSISMPLFCSIASISPRVVGSNVVGTYSTMTFRSTILVMYMPPMFLRNIFMTGFACSQFAACVVSICSRTLPVHNFFAPTKVVPSGASVLAMPIRSSAMMAFCTISFSVSFVRVLLLADGSFSMSICQLAVSPCVIVVACAGSGW